MSLTTPSNNSQDELNQQLPSFAIVGRVFQSVCDSNAHGHVAMVFERSAYIQFGQSLLCIGLREIGASSITGLFASQLSMMPAIFKVGTRVAFSDNMLWVNEKACWNLSSATSYQSSVQSLGVNAKQASDFALSVAKFNQKLVLPTDGLAPLLNVLNTVEWRHHNYDSDVVLHCLPAISRLFDQLRHCIVSSKQAHVSTDQSATSYQQLLGAGPGLTPSGDDFICGVFAALFVFDKPRIAQLLWESIAPHLASRTTAVSSALLKQAAMGELNEYYEKLVEAYFSDSIESVQAVQSYADSFGGSSGWDWLAGLVLGHQTLSELANRPG